MLLAATKGLPERVFVVRDGSPLEGGEVMGEAQPRRFGPVSALCVPLDASRLKGLRTLQAFDIAGKPLSRSLSIGKAPTANWQIEAAFDGHPIVLRGTERLAGAVDSLTWNGQEFIDSHDHGRQLQAALVLDQQKEDLNPTEAGGRLDGTGNSSSSRLIWAKAKGSRVRTLTQMAYWNLAMHGSDSVEYEQLSARSPYLLEKEIQIGFESWPNVIRTKWTYHFPADRTTSFAQFEAPAFYLPEDFLACQAYDPASDSFRPYLAGWGEVPTPLLYSIETGSHAAALYHPGLARQQMGSESGFGARKFDVERVVKLNCVFRVADPGQGTSHSFETFVVLGTQAQVQETLRALHRRFA